MAEDRFYIDCEFDGHGGPLLSMAIVGEDGIGFHIKVACEEAHDPWVIENVVPLMDNYDADFFVECPPYHVGTWLRRMLEYVTCPVIIADSPVDIGRFCAAISTDEAGNWASCDYPQMTFEVHNVDPYPSALEGAVQHNAWWDAMALREIFIAQPDPDHVTG